MQRSNSVDAFEGDAAAAESLRRAGHSAAYQRDLFRHPLTESELNGYECVVIDPPRAGAKEQSRFLAQSAVPVIIAVSCNPVTFARDAGILVNGGYTFRRARFVDQFLWSPHIELVGLFTRK